MHTLQFLFLFLLEVVVPFNLHYVSLDPMPRPAFLYNATYEVVEQFMGLLRVPFIDGKRKVSELEILVSSLRPEIQQAYTELKEEALMTRLEEEDQRTELVEKAHYVIAHLYALKSTKKMSQSERRKRIEIVFAEFNEYMVHVMTSRIQRIIEDVMHQMTRAVLFSERLAT